MQATPRESPTLAWLRELGLTDAEVAQLNPCVPGEFTLPDVLYVNTATPRVIYRGTEEGTLPLVAGRWSLIPNDTVRRLPNLANGVVRVARAVRLAR